MRLPPDITRELQEIARQATALARRAERAAEAAKKARYPRAALAIDDTARRFVGLAAGLETTCAP